MGIYDELLLRGDDGDRPSLESRVAYQGHACVDTLGYRSGTQRDQTILGWACELISDAHPVRVVDVGSAYGNMLFMLNAMMHKRSHIELIGLDIDERSMAYASAFAGLVDGYSNCHFRIHDTTQRLPFDDRSVDVLIAADVLEHLRDVRAVLRDIRRVLRPSGSLILSTPLADSLFKRLATIANRLSGGRLNRVYYRGKGTDIDDSGMPIMAVNAGHEHISEMNYRELLAVLNDSGFRIRRQRLSPIMSGSCWFDRHPALLSALLAIEALHIRLNRPSWAHGVVLEVQPSK